MQHDDSPRRFGGTNLHKHDLPNRGRLLYPLGNEDVETIVPTNEITTKGLKGDYACASARHENPL